MFEERGSNPRAGTNEISNLNPIRRSDPSIRSESALLLQATHGDAVPDISNYVCDRGVRSRTRSA